MIASASRARSDEPAVRHASRIAQPPFSALDGAKKFLNRAIERIGLLEVYGVPRTRHHPECGARNGSLEEQIGIEARFVLIADDQQNRQRHLRKFGG